ncbi:HAMP domain-containing histidine kinase [Bacteroides sp. OttesenSCG-928-F21]|nr:HAMP domain-containing histidine kinase [Bacteroides sp. OttesenSCG-928-F21]
MYATDIETKLSLLRTLHAKNLVYDDGMPVDTVLKWGHELEEYLGEREQYNDLFGAKHLIANALCRLGDISLAIDKVRIMFEESQESNYNFGIAMAFQAAGNTSAFSNSLTDAIKSYEKADEFFEKINEVGRYRKLLYNELIYTYLQMRQPEKALLYLNKIERLITIGSNDPIYLSYITNKAYYHIQVAEQEKAWLCLEEARMIIDDQQQKNNLNVFSFHIVRGKYYEKEKEYDLALKEYDLVASNDAGKLDPVKYTELISYKTKVLKEQGKAKEACLLFQEISEIKDSLNYQSYARQVNDLRATYQVNQMEIEYQSHKNTLIKTVTIFLAILLFITIFFIVYIIRSSRLLNSSKEEQKKAKIQAEKSAHSKSLFLSNMSHEIRTPLNALTGFSAILTEESIDNETRQQCNDIIQQNSHLLLKLIDDVIDLSSIEFGKMQFKFKENDAVSICRNVTEMVEKVKQSNASILFESSLNSLILYTDDARLQQVLINLLINATKFTPSGTITLGLEINKQGDAQFSVTDTGCGIPLKKQKQIFDRFEKLNEVKQGTGLGLSICKLIINHIGGRIWIDPSYTDGSRFCFTHPINREENRK